MIEREAALSTPERPGRIIMKMNNLSDDGMVNALYDASEQGVKVDLIVRSICTLRPGVKSLSKNISVRSHPGAVPRALARLLLRRTAATSRSTSAAPT